MSTGNLAALAADIVQRAVARGAQAAECTISEGSEFSAVVRMREVESVKESGSRGAGIRVLQGKCAGSSYTSDLTEAGIERMVESAIEMARHATEDPFLGLPDASELGSLGLDLQLSSSDITISTEEKIAMAKRAEEAALDFDPRVVNSEGATFDNYSGTRAFANSLGFAGEYSSTSCSISMVPVARDGGSMERDYWYSVARGLAGLEAPEVIGRIAAERTVRRLNARKLETRKVPVLFEPRVARSFVDHIFEAVHGEMVYRQATFLAGKLGEQIAAANVNVIDDGTLPGRFGSSPFDDEGVPSRRNVIVENGVLRTYLCNTYTARKLGTRTTGSASRGLSGNAGIGHGNLYLEPGVQSAEEILRGIGSGLLVTELIGSGFNAVTGDYSRGAAGLWIENGEIAYPVAEITIAGKMQDMLKDIVAIGNDLEFRGSTVSPTILIGEMTVAGK